MAIELDKLTVVVKKGKLSYTSNEVALLDLADLSADEHRGYVTKGWFIRDVEGSYHVFSVRLDTDAMTAGVNALSTRLGV